MSVKRTDIAAKKKDDGVPRCETCGTPLPPRSPGKAGAPTRFCPSGKKGAQSSCWLVNHHKVGLESAVTEIQDRFGPEEWLKFRGEIWSIINNRPWNKGVKRKAKAPAPAA